MAAEQSWAALFILQALLVLVAGIAHSDLVIRPGWNLASLLGAAFIVYALVVYPAIGAADEPAEGSGEWMLTPMSTHTLGDADRGTEVH